MGQYASSTLSTGHSHDRKNHMPLAGPLPAARLRKNMHYQKVGVVLMMIFRKSIASRTDEWYSFEKSARKPGIAILATLDEATYSPKGLFGQKLAMGKDHPIVWSHCTGKGRALYSAMGHQSAAYAESDYRKLLSGATRWVLKLAGAGCDTAATLEVQK